MYFGGATGDVKFCYVERVWHLCRASYRKLKFEFCGSVAGILRRGIPCPPPKNCGAAMQCCLDDSERLQTILARPQEEVHSKEAICFLEIGAEAPGFQGEPINDDNQEGIANDCRTHSCGKGKGGRHDPAAPDFG
jgi:hypothetical protein